MLFENCPFHPDLSLNIIIDSKTTTKLLCSDCFNNLPDHEHRIGVFLNQNTMNFFFKWNEYLAEELVTIRNKVSRQGFDCILKNISLNLEQQKTNEEQKRGLGAADPKQVLGFIISQHVDLLHRNMAYMSQPRRLEELINPMFLKDLFTIVARQIQDVILPIKAEFIQILQKQFHSDYQFKWSQEVIRCISNVRSQIMNDWARYCVIEQKSLKDSLAKISEVSSERLETENSLNKSVVSCESLNFQDDEADRIHLMQASALDYSQVLIEEDTLLKPDSGDISLIRENQSLKVTLQEKSRILQDLAQRLAHSEEETEDWMFKYRLLQENHEQITSQRIPSIQDQVFELQQEVEILLSLNEEQSMCMTVMQAKINELKEQNSQLSEQKQGYYINPVYQRQKVDEKLLEEVVELQAVNMQKDHDINLMIKCIQMTRKLLINYGKSKKTSSQNKENELFDEWQKLIQPQLNSLYTVRLKSCA